MTSGTPAVRAPVLKSLAPTAFSSADYGLEDGAKAWRRALSRAYGDVEMAACSAKSFPASVTAEWSGGVQVAIEESGPVVIARRGSGVGIESRRHILARLQVAGDVLLIQDGRSLRVPAGALVLHDAGRPFKIVCSGRQRAYVLTMPRALMRLEESALRAVTATLIDDDAVGALSMLAAALVEEHAVADAALRGHLARAAADVVCAAVTHQISRNPPAGVPRPALLDRVKAAIEERLGDPDLTPQAIADRHHISVRYLHVLFQQQGTTVNGWVRERRLEAAGRDLARPDAHRRSVAGVAARWGFSNSSHFSRAFREAYGMSPMQWRKRRSTSTSTVE